MSEKFQNKYRISSARLQNWDYGWAGAYFVTICTKNRECYFGDIVYETMNYTPLGAIANVLWYELKNHRSNVELDAFQVMPNHFHGIIILKNEIVDIDDAVDGGNAVETRRALSLQQRTQSSPGQQRFQNQGKNTLSSIVGAYKSAVTKHANRLGLNNGWQSRFHDHIIRDKNEFERIRNYIINNPVNWNTDRFR